MHNFLLSLFGLMAFGSASLSYPVFGTKRYTRANLLPPSDYGSSLSMPLYSPVPQYYDNQPQYVPVPSYSSDYYDDNGYYNNNYYYAPPVHRRHQRQDRYPSYGLPTYRGEYKPTPYYYAHAPSYSYSDDRESNNPLDDLHEEMLQEDERERARDFMPVGQEQWYESPSRHSPDSTFLRNLIMYNNQLNSLRSKPVESNEEYDEYEEVEPEYYDTSYSDNRNSFNPFLNNYNGNTNNRNTLSKITSLRNSMAKNAVEDDEEVQELKSLIHQQKNSRLHQQEQQQEDLKQQQLQQQQLHQQLGSHPQTETPAPVADIKQQQQRSLANDYQQYGASDSWQRDSPSYSSYDYENEYDDSWSHWDRKRNIQPKKVLLVLPPNIPPTPITSSSSSSTTTTTTVKPKVEIIHGHNGQKEVVLPRPALPARNPFGNVNGLQKGAHAAGASDAVPQGKLEKQKSGNVYDTIKKIITMQQNLEGNELTQQLDNQKHRGSRVQKRIVASAESLVQQLDGLKRTA